MQYELYIDIFFLVNFLLDYFVLLIMRKVMKCTATYFHLFLGAMAGAILTCILVCISIPEILKNFILYFGVNGIMLKAAFGISKKDFLKFWLLSYLISILMGGTMTCLSQHIGGHFRTLIVFVSIAVTTYVIVMKVSEFLENYWKVSAKKCRVVLEWENQSREVRALYDTGNLLVDQITGKPVHVISANAIKKFTKEELYPLRYIPYQTVQGDSKVMPLIKIDRMCILGEQKVIIEHPFLAISECLDFGNGDYEIILHPDCMRED